MFMHMLPPNNIRVPGDMKVSFGLVPGTMARIDNDRISAYFTGKITNMGD